MSVNVESGSVKLEKILLLRCYNIVSVVKRFFSDMFAIAQEWLIR
jgi:hypothetical protein